jgi:hypothetical protein
MALYEAYDRLPMPNMRLTDKDVTSLLGYIEGESRRIAAVRAGKMEDHSRHADMAEHGDHAEHTEHAGR